MKLVGDGADASANDQWGKIKFNFCSCARVQLNILVYKKVISNKTLFFVIAIKKLVYENII